MANRSFKRAPSQPPADAVAGAALIRAAAVKLYDQQDGTGVDWRAVTEALFRAAFDALDKLPDDACRSVARRVHEGAYGRVTEGPGAGVASGINPADTHIGLRPSPDIGPGIPER